MSVTSSEAKTGDDDREAILRRRLAVNVRRHRCAQQRTVENAAEGAALNWRHWQKIERSEVNVTLKTLVRLAASLGVLPGQLLT